MGRGGGGYLIVNIFLGVEIAPDGTYNTNTTNTTNDNTQVFMVCHQYSI